MLSTPKHVNFNMNMKLGFLVLALVLFVGLPNTFAQKKFSKFKIAKAGVGIDGLRVGKSTRADVVRKYGRNFTTKKYGKYSAQMRYRNGMSFYYCQKDRKQEIFDIELRSPAKVKTSKGIVLSKSTIGELRKHYGKPIKGLQFRGIEFYYNSFRGRKVITVIDIVEKNGMRLCS